MISPVDGYGILTGVLKFKGFRQVSKREKARWLLIYPAVLIIFLYHLINNTVFGLFEGRKERKEKRDVK